jgi:hypothetical protein
MVTRLGLVVLFLLVLAIIGPPSLAARHTPGQPQFSSAFTDLSKECRNAFKSVGEGQDMPLKCKGYGPYYVYIFYSAFASHLSIKTTGSDDFIYLAPEKLNYSDQKDSRIEWRLADGQPFAVILKVSHYDDKAQEMGANPYQDKYKIGEVLLIIGLKGHRDIDFQVDANTPDAPAKARGLADHAYLKSQP